MHEGDKYTTRAKEVIPNFLILGALYVADHRDGALKTPQVKPNSGPGPGTDAALPVPMSREYGRCSYGTLLRRFFLLRVPLN
jgi:hypothetical protein